MSKVLRYLRLRGRLGDNGPPFMAELPPGVHRLGSVDDNDIVVRSHGVSRHHLLLRVDDTVTIEDLGSKNGTRINGRSRTQGALEIGDELFIGPVRLRLEAAEADDVRLAATAAGDRPILEASDLELDSRGSEEKELELIDRAFEGLEPNERAAGGLQSLGHVAQTIAARGASWLVWWERKRALVTASWGADFHGLLDLEALCQRAEALAGSKKTVVLRSLGPPSLIAVVLLARPHPSALLLWDVELSAMAARVLARLLDRESAVLEADQAAAGTPPPPAVGWVAGPGPASRLLQARVERALRQSLPILLEGEAGTGKKHLARWIHAAEERPGPLVIAQCGELSDAALAQGFRVAAEEKGTLLLEEVGDLAPSLYEPVLQILGASGGRPRTLLTSREIGSLTLPEELQSALRRQVITLEPLNQRREEIPSLVRHFLTQAIFDKPEKNPTVRGITVEAMRRLALRDWPGHVEELRRHIDELRRRAVGKVIDAASWPDSPSRASKAASSAAGSSTASTATSSTATSWAARTSVERSSVERPSKERSSTEGSLDAGEP